MRTVYYVLRFACLFLLLCCVNFARWLITRFQLALLGVRRWPPPRSREWRRESAARPAGQTN